MLLRPSKTSVTHAPKPTCVRPGRKGIYLLTFSPHWLRVEHETNPTLIGCTCAQPRCYRARESPQVGAVKMKSLAYLRPTSVQVNIDGLIEYYGVSTMPVRIFVAGAQEPAYFKVPQNLWCALRCWSYYSNSRAGILNILCHSIVAGLASFAVI